MSALDLSYATPFLGLLAPAATLTGVFLTINYNRRQRLSDRLNALFTTENKAGLRAILETDQRILVADATKAEPALQLLLQFQQVANSISESPRHWDHALSHNDLQLLHNAVEQAALLIQTVRGTDWKFETKAWNGCRRRAFESLLKACKIYLPKN